MHNSKLLTQFFALASLEGLICLVILLTLTPDPETAWFLNYSRNRSLMLILTLFGIIIFVSLTIRSKKDEDWSDRIIGYIHTFFNNKKNVTIVLGLLIFGLFAGILFLYSTYAQIDYFIRPRTVASFELVRIYMTRIVPFILWGELLTIQSLVLLSALGYGTRNDYYRVVRLISVTIFPILLCVFWLINLNDPDFYHYINNEDQQVEWLSFVSLIIAGFLALLKSYKVYRTDHHYFWFFVLFGIACLVLGMEEISWGQRIFQLESTEFFMQNSDQQEINAHNVINEWFSIRTKHVAAFVLFIFGVVLPVLSLNKNIEIFLERIRIVVPPVFLSFGFALGAFLTLDIFSGREEEVAELFLSLGLLLFIILENLKPDLSNALNGENGSQHFMTFKTRS
jgi:hypothetical protein